MITKKEFKELTTEEQLNLVNKELTQAKGTKNFGNFDLDFSYGFARSILITEGYDTLEEETVDGVKVKLFRKMTEEELQAKEEKIKEKEDLKIENTKIEEPEILLNDVSMQVASDMYNKNLNIEKNKKTISKTLPIFEDTYVEFTELLNTDEFKLYEKKYIIELMMRNFIDKYKKN